MKKEKTIAERIEAKIKRAKKYHTIYHKNVALTEEEIEWLEQQKEENFEYPSFGSSTEPLIQGNELWLTFDY